MHVPYAFPFVHVLMGLALVRAWQLGALLRTASATQPPAPQELAAAVSTTVSLLGRRTSAGGAQAVHSPPVPAGWGAMVDRDDAARSASPACHLVGGTPPRTPPGTGGGGGESCCRREFCHFAAPPISLQ